MSHRILCCHSLLTNHMWRCMYSSKVRVWTVVTTTARVSEVCARVIIFGRAKTAASKSINGKSLPFNPDYMWVFWEISPKSRRDSKIYDLQEDTFIHSLGWKYYRIEENGTRLNLEVKQTSNYGNIIIGFNYRDLPGDLSGASTFFTSNWTISEYVSGWEETEGT